MRALHKTLFFLVAPTLFNNACALEGDANTPHHFLESAANAIGQSNNIEMAKLQVTSFESARNLALKNKTEIIGYPISGTVLTPPSDKNAYLKNILLNKGNYIKVRARCKKEHFIGLRFNSAEDKIVEFALGVPCNQALWGINVSGKTVFWGSTLNSDSSNEIKTMFESLHDQL